MIFGSFVLFVALSISAVAMYYSIYGLTAIFAAAVMPIIIMGVALEVGKLAAVVWLHKYWDRAAIQFKLYLVPAVIILMLITSMGIFGFLSKAHMDQTIPAGDVSAQVQIFDERINTERDNIDASRKALKQMDAQVDERLGRSSDEKGAERAVQIRRNQAKERKVLQKEIAQAQQNIVKLQTERAPIATQVRKVEAEVGPIKYIAALVYGDNPDANLLERAVRWVIILLVLVFDPLAIVLILAGEQSILWAREDKKKLPGTEDDPGTQAFFDNGKKFAKSIDDGTFVPPKYELDDGQLTDEQYEQIKKESGIDQTSAISADDWLDFKIEQAEESAAHSGNKHAYLNKPWVWMKNSEGPVGFVPITNPESNPDVIATVPDTTKQDLDNAISLIAEMQTKLDAMQAKNEDDLKKKLNP